MPVTGGSRLATAAEAITIVPTLCYVLRVDRDRKILDTAAAVFYEKGFHGASVDELGVRAGLSGPAIYRHFSGKNEILAALFNEAMDELMSATVTVHDDPHLDLERALRHHIRFATGNRHLLNVYQREDRSLVEPWRRHFDRRRQKYVERWEHMFARCFPEAEPAAISAINQTCLGAIFSISYWPTRVLNGMDVEEQTMEFLNSGLAGFANA